MLEIAEGAPSAPLLGPRDYPPTNRGWPATSNTGVPPGTNFTPSGRITITQAGAVIDGSDISASGPRPGGVGQRPNVTIRNSRVRGNAIALIQKTRPGLVVEDGELSNPAERGGSPTATTASPPSQ